MQRASLARALWWRRTKSSPSRSLEATQADNDVRIDPGRSKPAVVQKAPASPRLISTLQRLLRRPGSAVPAIRLTDSVPIDHAESEEIIDVPSSAAFRARTVVVALSSGAMRRLGPT